ncbi:MAG: hypothetical protein P1U68_15640 [Verrucomicrobiales bacterium]|nr:hypothetical protein [Verrucomicrobiales bacterium]
MKKRNRTMPRVSPKTQPGNSEGGRPRNPSGERANLSGLSLGNELMELCTEIAGALLRGYTDEKPGRSVRQAIVNGLVEKMACRKVQAESLVDLSLELIHLQAYGEYRSDVLELSLLVAKSGGEVSETSFN